MKRKHKKTLELLFARPVSGSVKWPEIESLFKALGAKISEREGSRVGVFFLMKFRFFKGLIHLQTLIKEQFQVFENG